MNLSAARVTTRIARRNIGRHRGRSMLIVLLVLLPVAAMVAAKSILRTITPTKEQLDTSLMGRADLLAQVATQDAVLKYLPAGSVTTFMSRHAACARWADGFGSQPVAAGAA